MKKYLIILTLFCALLTGCGTARQTVQVVRETTCDTLYLNQFRYDSIYVDKWHSVDRGRDTVYVVDHHTEYRYKLLRDTCYVHQVDSIPVIKTVVERVETRYVPGIYKVCLWVCIGLVILIVLFIAIKIVL